MEKFLAWLRANKKIVIIAAVSVLLVAALTVGAILIFGGKDNNGDNGDSNSDNNNNSAVKVDYTFTLVDQYNNGVAGVEVEFRVGPKQAGQIYKTTTDENGVAKINIEETNLLIKVAVSSNLPVGYSGAGLGVVEFEEGDKSAEASLIKLVAHTVFVVDESENAVSGANVQVCVDGACQVAVDTDAEGKAIFYVNPDAEEAYAQFNTAPEGYNAPANAKIYYVDGATEATFVLTAK